MIKVINYLGNRLGSGGIESFVTNMSYGMCEENVEYIVCINYKTENIYESKIIENGGKIVYLAEDDDTYLSKLFRFTRYIWKNKDAILYLHASTAGMYLQAFIAKTLGVKKIVYHVHSTKCPLYHGIKKYKDKILEILFKNTPDIRVACSDKAGKDLFKKMNFNVVHNGVDLQRFRFRLDYREDIRRKYDLGDKFVIGQIGRLSSTKNQLFTIKVFEQYHSKVNKDAILLMVGEGEDKDKLIETVKIKGIEESIRFISPIKEVEKIYSAIDVMMFPSIWEGLGIVAIEAQAAGLPVLCSENIVNEVYVTELMHKVPLMEEEQWINKLKLVQNSKTNRSFMSQIGRDQCEKAGFSLAGTHKELIGIYKQR